MTDQVFDELRELLGNGGRLFTSSNNTMKEPFVVVDDDVARASKHHVPRVYDFGDVLHLSLTIIVAQKFHAI